MAADKDDNRRKRQETDGERVVRLFSNINRNATERKKRKYLHDFFKPRRCPDRIAVIYDEGLGNAVKMTYKDVENVTYRVEEEIRKKLDAGFIGVCFPQNHLFPSIQMGIMRAGCTVVNIDERDWDNMVDSGRKILKMEYLILHEDEFFKRSTWVIKNSSEQNYIDIVMNGRSEIVRFIRLKNALFNESIGSIVDPLPFKFAYAAFTSGSTGNKKLVLVPHNCIIPNIEDTITKVWMLSREDVIFGCSPQTFDPSVVELFSALGKEACILYLPLPIKLDGNRLGRMLLTHNASVLPITPSLMRNIGDRLKATGVFDPERTSLEVIAFGGERCLEKEELRTYLSEKFCSKLRRIVSLYGLTEMSCWASYETIDVYGHKKILLGEPFSQTRLRVAFDTEEQLNDGLGEIQLLSNTRKCTILDDIGQIVNLPSWNQDGKSEFVIRTGDFGISFKQDGFSRRVLYLGRGDRMAKKNGRKMSLSFIEKFVMDSGQAQNCECVLWENKIYLLVVLKERASSIFGLGRHVRAHLMPKTFLNFNPQFYPDFIIALHSIPLNANGKIDMPNIIKYVHKNPYPMVGAYGMTERTIIKSLVPLWKFATRREGKRHDVDELSKENFYVVGGDSSMAAWFAESTFESLNLWGTKIHTEMEPILHQRLNVATFGSCCRFLFDVVSSNPVEAKIGVVTAEGVSTFIASTKTKLDTIEYITPVSSFIAKEETRPIQHQVKDGPLRATTSCELGLRMCVDAKASVTLKGQCGGVLVIGSHSGHISAVDLILLRSLIDARDRSAYSGGAILWSLKLPGRVEAEVEFSEDGEFVYIACHDRCLYKVSAVNGSIIISFACEGAIRVKPAFDRLTRTVTVADDQDSIYVLDSLNLQLRWKRTLIGGLISASLPVSCSGKLVLATRSQGLIELNLLDGSRIWPDAEFKFEILTGPLLADISDVTDVFEMAHKILVAATKEGVECRDFDTGEILWRHKHLWGPLPPFPPQLHFCPNQMKMEVILTSRSGEILVYDVENKKGVVEISTSGVTEIPATVLCTRSSVDGKNTCYALSKPSGSSGFAINRMYDGGAETPDICTRMKYKVFSVPCSYEEFLLFGGRDNNLHIVAFNKSENCPGSDGK